jgi:signal transduction histidine kinase
MTHEAQQTPRSGANGHAAPTAPEAASVEKELSEFSYIVSHDLAASCRHLAQFSELLLRDLGPVLTESQRNYAKHIQAAGQKCQAMMEQLLVFSRIQSRELNSAPHEAMQLLSSARLQLSEKVKACPAEISIDGAGVAVGDGALLIVALRELIDNALKFRKPDQACVIRVSAKQDNGRFIVRVADNGIGLPEDLHEKAFRMFWQRKPDASNGIGAGLAICRRVARRHGGDVRFVDQDDGCCLEFDVPAPPVH